MRRYVCIISRFDNDLALKVAKSFSPNLEIIDQKTLVFDVVGKEAKRSQKIAKQIFNREIFTSLAVSDNLAASIFLAKNKDGVNFASESNPLSLNELPIETLNTKQNFLQLMEKWAIHTLGEFCQLPEDEMVARFGKEVVQLMRVADGSSFRQFNWNSEEDIYNWEEELKGEIETIEPLNFILSKGIGIIFNNMDQIGLSTQQAKISLSGRSSVKDYLVKIVFPNKKKKVWLKQIISKVELSPPGFGIDKVRVEFKPCKPRTIQNDLFEGVILEPENLDLLVSKLQKTVGIAKIGIPVIQNSWKDPFRLKNDISVLFRDSFINNHETIGSNFYYLPKSVRSKLFFKDNIPIRLLVGGKSLDVINAGGPWRKNTEWFNRSIWSRDEWDVETAGGAVYRVFRTDSGEVYVEGGYD